MREEFIKICEKYNVVGATCMITKDFKIQECINYGYANVLENKKVDENTIFRIASISKLLVATCIMQLVENKKLDLDEDVSKYLGFKLRNPLYPDKIIDLKMLLTHTSSISDGLEKDVNSDRNSGYNSLNGTDLEVDIKDMLVPGSKYYVDETFSKYEPGTHFEYSNFGTGILACILERVEKVFFFDYFKENISNRLGINASFMASDMNVNDIACTYIDKENLYRDNIRFHKYSVYKKKLGNNFIGAAGGLYISLADLKKVMDCYMNDGGCLLKKETMDRMLELTWYGERDGDYTAKGLQFQIMDVFEGKRLYGHFGCAYNVRSFLFFNPIQKLGMLCFLNGPTLYKEKNGITLVQYEMIESILNEYWDDSIEMDLNFDFNSSKAYLNNRCINLEFDKEKKGIRSLSNKSILDMFSISTWPGKKNVDECFKDKIFLDIINEDWNEFLYDIEVLEEYPDDTYNKKEMIEKYHIKYVKKKKNFDNSLNSNFHCHCSYCNHAKGNVMEYFDKAYEKGFKKYGMSDHGPLPASFVNWQISNKNGYVTWQMDYDTFINKYLKDIEEAKIKYENKMEVYKGIEIEYTYGEDEYYRELKSKLDYMILGQHHMMKNGEFLDSYKHINYTNVSEYASLVCAALDTKLFDILAHPDVFMLHYIGENNKLRCFDSHAISALKRIIEACIRNNVLIEFNLGGIYRGLRINQNSDKDYLYTRLSFWDLVSKYKDALVIIGCDCHNVNSVSSHNISKAKKILDNLGIKYLN